VAHESRGGSAHGVIVEPSGNKNDAVNTFLTGALVIFFAVGILVIIFKSNGPGVGKGTGTSIKRGAASHVNVDGSNKKKYSTLELAQAAAARQSSGENASFTAYRCAQCDGFHVGHAR
jgi:hypothetical protein